MTFRRRPGRLLNVLCTFNLRPVSTGYLEPSRKSTMGHLCENHKKSFIVDVQLGSKYASGISSAVGKVYRMSVFIECRKSTLSSKKIVIGFLVTGINKKQPKLGSFNERNLLI